jgi:catechol 2,3-dioxygenase-like lactoylglutathione lyase family enzyme
VGERFLLLPTFSNRTVCVTLESARERALHKLFLSALILLTSIPCFAAGSPRPQILGIAYVKFKSTNLAKSSDFYTNIVGLQPDGPACSGVPAPCFSVNGQQHIELVSTDPGIAGPYLVEIAFAVSNVNQMATFLTANHVPASKVLHRNDGTPYLEVLDPEHNRIVFIESRDAANSSSSDSAISHKIIHAGFVTHSADAENKFYEDLLGFRIYWKGGFHDQQINWFMNQVPDGDNWIEYMLLVPANADHRELGIQYHVSLGVPNIDETAALLKSRGAEFPAPITGLDGKRQLTLVDPDQTRIEVMEFTPVQKPCCSDYTGAHPKP